MVDQLLWSLLLQAVMKIKAHITQESFQAIVASKLTLKVNFNV